MKHTYTVILAILLVVALAVPAFASEETFYLYNDFKAKELPSSYQYAVITSDEYGAYELHCSDSNQLVWTGTGLQWTSKSKHALYSGQWAQMYDVTESAGYTYPAVKLVWASFNIYSTDGSLAIEGSEPQLYVPEVPHCDGTACPANDANADDICDDCGKMLRLVNTDYPAFPDVPGTYKHFVLSRASSGRYDYTVFKSVNEFTARGERADIYSANFSRVVTIYRYSSSNGGDWVLNVDGTTNNTFTVGATGYLDVLDSSFSWYDENGDPFFPPPLWEEMAQVTQGEMGALTSQTMKTVSILALCGVGCLALLILLHLLGKKSLIFHL